MNDKSKNICKKCNENILQEHIRYTKTGKISSICEKCYLDRKKLNAQKRREKNIATCKHCGTTENIKRGKTGFNLGICLDCFSIIGKTPGQQSREQKNLEKFGVISGFQRDDVKEKIKKSNLKNHGVEYPTQSKRIRRKIRKVVQQKYDVDNVSQLEAVKNKIIKTNLKKRGVKQVFQDKDVINKIERTNLKRYGTKHPTKNEQVKLRRSKTCLDRYGVDCVLKSDDVKDKVIQTNLEKYGVEYGVQSAIVKNKIARTNLNRYGVKVVTKAAEVVDKIKKTYRDRYWNKFLSLLKQKQITPLFDKDYYINNNNFQFLCEVCKNSFYSDKTNPQKIWCGCGKATSFSEIELYNFIESLLNCEVVRNKNFTISGKVRELDIFIPDYNMGIEYNGLYWHSELYKDSNYHSEKRELFDSIGINLVQVFESDWINKPEIVKSLLRTKLGLVNKIYGRNTEIFELTNEQAEEFLNINHLKGYVKAKYHIGLKYKEDIVCVMSVSIARFDKNYDYEILRFATKLNTSVTGGFSKIIKYLDSMGIKSLVSYVDLMYFNGSSYEQNGFKFIKKTKPGYYYWNKSKSLNLENRQSYQKHKLSNILDNFDNTLSEHENMLNNNYLRIYDAGNFVFGYVAN